MEKTHSAREGYPRSEISPFSTIIKKHTDPRGTISELWFKDRESCVIFETTAGTARGGEITTVDKHVALLSGRAFAVFLRDERESIENWQLYSHLFIPKGLPHLFVATEDSLILRWMETTSEWEDKNTHVPQLRRYVDDASERNALIERYYQQFPDIRNSLR